MNAFTTYPVAALHRNDVAALLNELQMTNYESGLYEIWITAVKYNYLASDECCLTLGYVVVFINIF